LPTKKINNLHSVKNTIILFTILALVTGLAIAIIPLSCPIGWSNIRIGDERGSVVVALGKGGYRDDEANCCVWETGAVNGRWALVVRFDNDGTGKVASGWYSFHNWFYDSEYNPLPRPYWQCNITTSFIE
jgi:hypothetical protein